MAKMFIDANKYLDFYSVEGIDVLIDRLCAIRSDILVTEQMVDEVRRNKFSRLLDVMPENAPEMTDYRCLKIMPTATKDKMTEQLRELEKTSIALHRKIQQEVNKLLKDLVECRDGISNALQNFFGTAAAATPEQINRARRRKELGNPPGKRQDPLGDQLSWEQFLDFVSGDPDIWIVTADEDFFVTIDNEPQLHPFLYADLKAATGKDAITVRCFRLLTKAVTEFYKRNKVQKPPLPKETELEKLVIAEQGHGEEQLEVSREAASEMLARGAAFIGIDYHSKATPAGHSKAIHSAVGVLCPQCGWKLIGPFRGGRASFSGAPKVPNELATHLLGHCSRCKRYCRWI